MSIMVIEDDADIRFCVREVLKEEGFIVHTFADAEQALLHLKNHRPPMLILLDLGLPGLDGAEFRARQLADERLAGIPIIVISAHPDGARDADRLGASGFLAKPFPPEELLHVVQNRAMTLPRMEHFLRGALRSASPGDDAHLDELLYAPAEDERPPFTEVVTWALRRELLRRSQLDALAQLGIRTVGDIREIDSTRDRLRERYDPRQFSRYGAEAVRAAAGIVEVIERARDDLACADLT